MRAPGRPAGRYLATLGGRGNDILDCGKGADLFVFKEGHGSDTVTGFQSGRDEIQIRKSTSETVYVSQEGDDVHLRFADIEIIVEGVT